MTENETIDEAIAEMVKTSWSHFVDAGGIGAVEEVLGALHGERERRIFESGWKLGFEQSVQMARRLSEELMKRDHGTNGQVAS